MAFAYSDMLTLIKDRQWAPVDIDWDAPGADLITTEQRPRLAAFMADLVWIEHVGAADNASWWPIARPAPLGIRTVDGVEHRVDCIIYAEDMP